MAQQLTDLAQGGAAAQQIGGQGVSQQVRPLALGIQSGARQRAADDATDGRTCQALVGRHHANKYPARGTRRTNFAEIARQRRTDVGGQRQPLQPLALAPHDKLAALPEVWRAWKDVKPDAPPVLAQFNAPEVA